MLSALYLKGVKQGDGQMTVLGLAISALFYCASRSQPMRRLSTARPPARIFCLQPCLSVLGQFSVHLLALLAVSKLCEEHVNPEDPSAMPDGPFRPNTFNSAVFLLSSVMQVRSAILPSLVVERRADVGSHVKTCSNRSTPSLAYCLLVCLPHIH